MTFSETSVASQKEILKVRTGGEYFRAITLANGAFTDGVCKAGNPIDESGNIDNGSDVASPIGILLNEVYEEIPNGTLVAGFATVNEANCNENAGITIETAVKTALSNIVFA